METSDVLVEVEVDQLEQNPFQVRISSEMDSAFLELKDSISKFGVIEPPVIRKSDKGLQIAAGHRRVKCCIQLGIKRIKCIQRQLTDEQMCETILDENLKRKSLNPVEEAKGYGNLREKFSWSEEKIAARFHVTRDIVAQRRRLLNFQKEIQEYVAKGQLNVSQAEAVATAPLSKQLELAKVVMARSLTVKATTDMARQLMEQEAANKLTLENIGGIVVGFSKRIGTLEAISADHELAVILDDFLAHAHTWKVDDCRHNFGGLCHRVSWPTEPTDWMEKLRELVEFKKHEDGTWRVQASKIVCSRCNLYEPRPGTAKA
jgi:ParB family chromosome partitioning protein